MILAVFAEDYCLDKFLVNISFMVIYYLILKAISDFELAASWAMVAKLIWLKIIHTVCMLVYASDAFLRFGSCGAFRFGSLSTF